MTSNEPKQASAVERAIWDKLIQIQKQLEIVSHDVNRIQQHLDITEHFNYKPIQTREDFFMVENLIKTDPNYTKALVSFIFWSKNILTRLFTDQLHF